jgi:hypothetical protein
MQLMQALAALGYRFEGPIINYPSEGPGIIRTDHGSLRETDLILLTTRPPMNDCELGDRRIIRRSFTDLEEKLFSGPLGAAFERCSRSEILLSHAAAAVSAGIAMRQSMVFRQHGGAAYQSYGSPITRKWYRFEKQDALTAVFLLYVEHAWPGGPAFLAAFGVGAKETLVWCHQLARRFQHLLCTTPFAMGEMRTGTLPKPPESLSFADSWEINLVGVAKEPLRGPRQAA